MTTFFDTNVLVYAFADDEAKRRRAQQILAEGGVISVQVVNEFANVLHKKQRQAWPRIEAALAVVENRLEVVRPLTIDTHRAAIVLARDHGLSFYDALIVAAAVEAGCVKLYSEDLQHGRRFGELAIVDPFGESFDE